ncbi:hypothetical protein ABT120_19895 [Nonomuraea angiospora]|uniref:hypothetical protein n=1 Tax=Nonomuraea angiospora TaxID=46172 RepID=UPI00332C5E81
MARADEPHWHLLLQHAHHAGLDAFRQVATVSPCGFARVRIKPATSGFARWLSRTGLHNFRYDPRQGGIVAVVRLRPEDLPGLDRVTVLQSYSGAQAYAHGYAAVLAQDGYPAFASVLSQLI